MNLIEQIAIEVNSNNFEEMQNSTITTVDFASQKISFDVNVTKKLQSNQEFHKLTELMVDIVGNQIRKKVRHLFNLKGRLWIARYVETKHTAGSDTIFVQIYMDPPPGVPGVSKNQKFFFTNKTVEFLC